MHNAIELRNLSIKPKINDISLKILSEYYEMYLYPYIFIYHIKTTDEDKDIKLRFNLDKFCHLLGLESIVKYSIPINKLHNYKGQTGWNNVVNLSIDIQHLKNINKRKFMNVKAKYVYFYLIPKLIENPIAVNYDILNVEPKTNIDCEILFYSNVENDNAIIHLGLEKDSDEYYFPKTFFVEKVSKKEDDIYIRKQQEISIEVKNRVIMQAKEL